MQDSIPKKDAYLTVLNSNTGEIAGVYKTSPLTGQYLMILNSGTKYDISVESEGYSNQTSSFEIPAKKGEFELKQIIKFHELKFPDQNLLITIPQAMCYFEDAEDSVEPISLKNQTWDSVKKSIQKHVSDFLR